MDADAIQLAFFQASLTLVGLLFIALSLAHPWSRQENQTRWRVSLTLAFLTVLLLSVLSLYSLAVVSSEAVNFYWISYALFIVSLGFIITEFFVIGGAFLGIKRPPETIPIPPPPPPPPPGR